MHAATLRHGMNPWPPLLANGIDACAIVAEVEPRRRLWNRNCAGTQFGGHRFAMANPFRVPPVMRRLGWARCVRDKAAKIEFTALARDPPPVDAAATDSAAHDFRRMARAACPRILGSSG